MAKKKWHDWPNIINQAGPATAPNVLNRSAKNHAPDPYPHGGHVKGWNNEHHTKRFKLAHPGTTRGHLHMGFAKKPVY